MPVFFLEPMWTMIASAVASCLPNHPSCCRSSILHGASLARTWDMNCAVTCSPRSFRKGLFGNSLWTNACRLCQWSSRWYALQQTHIAIENWWKEFEGGSGFLLTITNCQPYLAINFSSLRGMLMDVDATSKLGAIRHHISVALQDHWSNDCVAPACFGFCKLLNRTSLAFILDQLKILRMEYIE